MSPKIYDACAVSIAGRLMSESTSVALDYIDNDETVIVLGAGKGRTVYQAPGGRALKVSFELALPVVGNDLDLIKVYQDCETVQMSVYLLGSGRRITSPGGQLAAPKMVSRIGSSTSFEITWIGEPAEWQ